MKIAITGATSFTGFWFARELIERGHELFPLIRSEPSTYRDLRRERLSLLSESCVPLTAGSFGSDTFIDTVKALPAIDIFCHHAAEVTDYKSPHFNPLQALEKNTHRLPEVLKVLKEKGCRSLVLTGSIFEPGEGQGTPPLRAVSPYGLSKGLTSLYFDFHCELEGIALKKFIIPNPFGPYEEMRFTSFVAKTWLEGKSAPLTHPDYVRDNVPVTLLAKGYGAFIEGTRSKTNPGFYAGSQKEFTLRLQREMKKRLRVSCELEIRTQTDFSEPLERTNLEPLDPALLNWSEERFWDDLAHYYLEHYGR